MLSPVLPAAAALLSSAAGLACCYLFLSPIPLGFDPRIISLAAFTSAVLLISLALALLFRRKRRGPLLPAATALCAALSLAAMLHCLLRFALPYTTQELSFTSGNVTLSGTLFMPRGGGPYPGAVLLHGSSMGSRSQYRYYADHFARHGMASLIYDRRGSGRSEGIIGGAGLFELASDAKAALTWLRSQEGLMPARCGLWGFSQGASVAPLAARENPDAAFVICISGPGLPLGEQMLYTKRGLAEEHKAKSDALREQLWAASRSGDGMPELLRALQEAQDEPWYRSVGFPPILSEPDSFEPGNGPLPYRWKADYMNHDPVPVVTSLSCPVLMCYGAEDGIVPVAESLARIEAAMSRGAGADLTLEVYKGFGHMMFSRPSFASLIPRYPDDYLEDMLEWLRLKGILVRRDYAVRSLSRGPAHPRG